MQKKPWIYSCSTVVHRHLSRATLRSKRLHIGRGREREKETQTERYICLHDCVTQALVESDTEKQETAASERERERETQKERDIYVDIIVYHRH